MNKAELVAAVSEQAGVSKAEAARVLDAVIDSISGALKAGDKVALVGFGTFSIRHREAREGRNPKTKQQITIPASKTPVFKAGKTLKDAV